MKPVIAVLLALFVAACSNETPPPQVTKTEPAVLEPVVQPVPPVPVVAAVAPSQPNPDAALAAKVKKALEAASPEISQGVDVTAQEGVVRLFGTVGSGAHRSSAGRIAASTAGVSSVDNRIVVVKGS